MKFPFPQQLPPAHIKFAKTAMKILIRVSILFISFIILLLSFSLLKGNNEDNNSDQIIVIVMCVGNDYFHASIPQIMELVL